MSHAPHYDHNQTDKKHTGKIKFWQAEKGFGFILPDDPTVNNGADVFAHISRAGGRNFTRDERVVFTVGLDKRSGKVAALKIEAA